jgi:hypothetical protein
LLANCAVLKRSLQLIASPSYEPNKFYPQTYLGRGPVLRVPRSVDPIILPGCAMALPCVVLIFVINARLSDTKLPLWVCVRGAHFHHECALIPYQIATLGVPRCASALPCVRCAYFQLPWLSLAAPGCCWLLLAAPGYLWLLLVASGCC